MDGYILTRPSFKSAIKEEEFNLSKGSVLHQIDPHMGATVQRVEIIGGTNYCDDELQGSSSALSHI